MSTNKGYIAYNCLRCDKQNHYMVDIYIQNDFPLNLCDKHKNFKPNRFVVWLQHKYYLHYAFPKHYMEVRGLSYRQAKLQYYKLKYWQREVQHR